MTAKHKGTHTAQLGEGTRKRRWEDVRADGKRWAFHRYASLADFMDEATLTAEEHALVDDHEKLETAGISINGSHAGMGSRWRFGPAGYPQTPDAVRAAVLGARPPVAVERAFAKARKGTRAMIGRLRARAASTRRKRCWRIDDGEADVDRAMSGAPDFLRNRTKGAERPKVTIGFAMGQTASARPEDFAKVAAWVATAVEVIESAGIAVEVLGTLGAAGTSTLPKGELGMGGTDQVMMVVPIKRSTEPFVARRLLACGIPSVLRHFGFNERVARFGVHGGMGSSCAPTGELKEWIGVTHWIARVPNDEGRQQEILEGIIKDPRKGM